MVKIGYRVTRCPSLEMQLAQGLYETFVGYHTVTDSGAGEPKETVFKEVIDPNEFCRTAKTWLLNHLDWR
jgi:hypothetical protein